MILLIHLPFASWGDDKPYLMAAMGDSLTAGTFADTTTQTRISLNDIPSLFEPDFLYKNPRTLSWSSGLVIGSHYLRLQDWLSKHDASNGGLEILNTAVPGEKSRGLLAQVQRVLDEYKSGRYASLKYVTVTIGGNDACATHGQVVPNEEFKKNVFSALQSLATIRQSEPIRVLFSSIPNVPDTAVPSIRQTLTLGGLTTCRWARRHIFTYCSSLTSWQTPAEYRQAVAKVAEKNRAIQEIIQEASSKPEFSRLDLRFGPSVAQAPITPPLLGIDCFHPSQRGQEQFSEKLWQDQPWFK